MADDSSRLDVSVQAMREYFPEFSLSLPTAGQRGEAVWKGQVQPIRTMDHLADLLDDIHRERPVWVQMGGEVSHHPACTSAHEHNGWVDKLTDPFVSFDLELRYGGGRKHPKAFVRRPVLQESKARHLFNDGSICPYAPWKGVWLWDQNTIVDYAGHAVVWLIKWILWDQASVWIGPEINHDRRFLVQAIGRNQQCWCGSGRKYKVCHLEQDQLAMRPPH